MLGDFVANILNVGFGGIRVVISKIDEWREWVGHRINDNIIVNQIIR